MTLMERLALRRPRSRRAMRAYLSDPAVNTAPAGPPPVQTFVLGDGDGGVLGDGDGKTLGEKEV